MHFPLFVQSCAALRDDVADFERFGYIRTQSHPCCMWLDVFDGLISVDLLYHCWSSFCVLFDKLCSTTCTFCAILSSRDTHLITDMQEPSNKDRLCLSRDLCTVLKLWSSTAESPQGFAHGRDRTGIFWGKIHLRAICLGFTAYFCAIEDSPSMRSQILGIFGGCEWYWWE